MEQKFTFAYVTLFQSAGVERILRSGSEDANALLVGSRGLFSQSRLALAGDDVEGADRLLDESLRQMAEALRLVPDPVRQVKNDRMLFSRSLDEIQAWQASWLVASRWLVGSRGQESSAAAEDRLRELLAEGQTLAEKGAYGDANRVLQRAQELVLELGGDGLPPAGSAGGPSFASPEAQLEYDLARFQGAEDLLRVALARHRPPREVAKQVGTLNGEALRLKAQAVNLSNTGATQEALSFVQAAIDTLRQATEQVKGGNK